MALDRNTLSAAFDGDIQAQIIETFLNAPLDYQAAFKEKGITSDHRKVAIYSDFSAMPQKTEGAGYPTDEPIHRFSRTQTPNLYGLAFRVPEEFVDDDQLDLVQGWAQRLALSAADALNVQHAGIFNNGFDSNYTFGDSKELFATDHATAGGTEQNELTTPADLSTTSLNEALYTLRKTVDHRGKIMNLRAVRLIVPAELEKLASEIVGSDKASGTANNDLNFFRNKLSQVVVMPHLTDTDAWFIQAEMHGLVSVMRQGFASSSYFDEETDSIVHKAKMRFLADVDDWRGVFGTAGAA